jgi:adenylate kinase family enzyme
MRRIAIIGPTASGKSTLASRLSPLLDIPVYHLDALYWRPGRVPTPWDEWDESLREIVAREEWIIDGNFTRTLPERIEAADAVIFLDLPRRLCAAAVIRRRIRYRLRRAPGMPIGSRPMFNRLLFHWIWTFPQDHRPLFLDFLEKHAEGRRIVILHSRREVRQFVRSLEQAQTGLPISREQSSRSV